VVGSGQVGVFVEYTPLPEAVFPTQLEESYAALKWVAAHAGEFGADGTRIAVAGNSVGANMTAALTLMAKDRKGPKITYQVLFIPATDASVDTDSYHEFGTGRFLARAFMKYGWDLYAPDEKTRNNPYVSPLRASNEELQGLPPALVITAENDPLRDEGKAYAHKLMDAGVAVAATRYDGMIPFHGGTAPMVTKLRLACAPVLPNLTIPVQARSPRHIREIRNPHIRPAVHLNPHSLLSLFCTLLC
jgi:acetyl esterase